MSDTLRYQLQKLARENPDIRRHLLPLLRRTAAGDRGYLIHNDSKRVRVVLTVRHRGGKAPLSALAKGDKTIQTSLKVVAKALAGNTGTDHFVASDGGKLLNVGKIEWPKVDQLTLANGLDVGDEIFGLQDTLKSLGFRPEQ